MLTLDVVREELLHVIQDEARHGKTVLLRNPRRIGKRFVSQMRPRYREAFSVHLTRVLKSGGYRSLTPLVEEQVREYFRLAASGCVEPRLVRRGGF